MDQPLATLAPSPARRVIATAMLGLTGLLLLGVAVVQPPAPGWRVYLIAVGAVAVWLTARLWRATSGQVVLTEAGLFTGEGRCLCPVEEVAHVERGTFAFKPSNGFVVHMKSRRPRGWAPGLWWSTGRRLGIGGATPAAQGRIMADLLAALVAGHLPPRAPDG